MSHVVDLRRYWGIARAAVPLLIICEILNAVLEYTVPPQPVRSELPISYREIAQWKAERLLRYSELNSDSNPKFLVYFGASSTAEGIEPGRLAREDAYGHPVCGICCIYSGFHFIEMLVEPLLAKHVYPAEVMFCIHLSYLTRHAAPSPAPVVTTTQRLYRLLTLRAILSNRHVMSNQIRGVFARERAHLKINRADRSPWTPPERIKIQGTKWDEVIKNEMSNWERERWFDPAAYLQFQDQNADDFLDLISSFEKNGSHVTVVLMCERSDLRERIPEQALPYLKDRIGRRFTEDRVAVLNLIDAVPDELFSDLIHLNDEGRQVFTERLANEMFLKSNAEKSH